MRSDYDFILVGGGCSACVLASQLLHLTKARVAIIEAGERPLGKRVTTPALYPFLWSSSKDWGWQTEPQASLRNRRIAWPRGRMLGGSASMNAMIFSLGHPRDADHYPSQWNWNAAVTALREIVPPHWLNSPPISAASELFLQACQKHGLSEFLDDAVVLNQSCGAFARTHRNGRRFSAYDAFLKPQLDHPRLTVISDSLAERILWNDQRASGVAVYSSTSQSSFELHASKAVCLCSGTIGTPILLMKSGIGPKSSLTNLDVPQVSVNEAVGRNLKDHLVFPVVAAVNQEYSLPAVGDRDSRQQYATSRSGPLASNLAEAGAFFAANSDSPTPTVQLHFTPTSYLQYPLSKSHRAAISIGVTPLHPTSFGSIEYNAARKCWTIDPHYLDTSADLMTFVDGIQFAERLFDTEPLRSIVNRQLMPKPSNDNPTAIEQAIGSFAQSIYHPTGTCKMGATGEAVVDATCRVLQASQLYIADASIIPEPTTGNPQGTVMSIAARVAQILAGL